jgi:hypothetical protein
MHGAVDLNSGDRIAQKTIQQQRDATTLTLNVGPLHDPRIYSLNQRLAQNA